MAFDDKQKELYERAARIEEMEGTFKYVYTAENQDLAEYLASSRKSSYKLCIIGAIVFLVMLVISILLDLSLLISIFAGMLGFWVLFIIVLLVSEKIGQKKLKNNTITADEVELAFNSYGVVFKMCNDIRTAVHAYEWKEFETITEYEKVLVGVKQNIAYIFPKRVFSEEEFNIFRRFSHAALGTKCFYKNFKP